MQQDFGEKENVQVENNKLVISREKLDVIVEQIKADSLRKVINIDIAEEGALITESKFGGYPYWPNNMEYPVNSEGKKLILLAQINFSDICDDHLPSSGLLQFFIDCDDLMGYDDENGYKVVYHDAIDPAVTEESVKALGIRAASDLGKGSDIEEYMPLEKCFAIRFSEKAEYINCWCNTFENIFADKLRELYGIDMKAVEGKSFCNLYGFLSESDYDYICKVFGGGDGHKIFGYPYFTQMDPRENGKNDILLFQMDSEFGEGVDKVMWGDSGVGHFFISEENLKNLDFDKAVYNWDCC